ncbi:MOSC domain-containing protein [Novosphingobium nitrogenifigens DSM 19370]|uniref:MOSC domain-containing protein n=1 Tax=Novosphingobium nitrogenifigens DSM 19370 TaxID=983920 RepID=F1ZAT5_9SPHN|nr:MOSC N-terminal beta barrel domain-containing protein [Novosphingobium nitrogenifigens]EGD58126.1 MOSC domain-containing protein [Novosphingobium nitrogenifigens DSM 19370]
MHVSGLYLYPVKSLGGGALDRATVEPMGLSGDRRWMVTNPVGRFLTRRELPAMARLSAAVTDFGLVLSHPEAGDHAVAIPGEGDWHDVQVWRDHLDARDAGGDVAQWLSGVLGRDVRLVWMPETVRRPVDPAFAQVDDRVSFADGFPLLITTVESLDALNARLPAPIPMARFRPNLVLSGVSGAFAEDEWNVLRIGTLTLRVVKPCTRCVITTQDVDSGAIAYPGEPLRTLRAMGRIMPGKGKAGESIFGQNAIPDATATIAVGDRVEILA